MSVLHRGIVVFSEEQGTCLELLSKARDVADGLNVPVGVALLGDDIKAKAAELGRWGADRVYTLEDPRLKEFNVEPYTDALVGLTNQVKPEVVLFGASKQCSELAPRVAARLGSGCVSACVNLQIDPTTRDIEAQAMIYGGMGVATYRIQGRPAIVLTAPNAFAREVLDGRNVKVVACQATLGESRVQILEVKPRMAEGTRLENARVVIDVGQGVREEEDLAMVQELADLLGGQLGCTRPLASERDWFPEWLGLSGRSVSPRLCITLGVSGAIQHVVGIRGSEVIVAVDNDEHSGMLTQADYGVVEDLYQFVPALLEVLKARGLRTV